MIRGGSVLAHGDHLDEEDFSIIAGGGAGVAHCPLSNGYFANAVFPARRALDAGVKVGLGTDIAGGAAPGLLPQAAHAVTVSRMLEARPNAALQTWDVDEHARIFEKVVRLATPEDICDVFVDGLRVAGSRPT